MSVCLYFCMSVCLYVCMAVCLYVCQAPAQPPPLNGLPHLLKSCTCIRNFSNFEGCIERNGHFGQRNDCFSALNGCLECRNSCFGIQTAVLESDAETTVSAYKTINSGTETNAAMKAMWRHGLMLVDTVRLDSEKLAAPSDDSMRERRSEKASSQHPQQLP